MSNCENCAKFESLEKYLKLKSESSEEELKKNFPSGKSAYFEYYIKAKSIFEKKYYSDIDFATNVGEGKGTVYTRHGLEHINQLVI